MMKRFTAFLFLLSLLISPAIAGVYEDALKTNDKVFLYLYTPDCRVCKIFNSTYDKLAKENKEFGFVKVNADTSYGRYLIIRFKGRYVPYIIMTNSKTKRSVNISHSCVMDDVCLLRAMKSFN